MGLISRVSSRTYRFIFCNFFKKLQKMTDADAELRQAFSDLRESVIKVKNEKEMISFQLGNAEKKLVTAQLTAARLKNVNKTKKVYNSIGRMFLLTTFDEVEADLTGQQTEFSKKITDLKGKYEMLDKSINSKQLELREMVQRRKL